MSKKSNEMSNKNISSNKANKPGNINSFYGDVVKSFHK